MQRSKQHKKSKQTGLKSAVVDRHLRFVLFLALVGMAFIWNTHYAERQVRELGQLKSQVKRLKAKYLEKKAILHAGTQFQVIKDRAALVGLKSDNEPPFKLIQTKNTEDKE